MCVLTFASLQFPDHNATPPQSPASNHITPSLSPGRRRGELTAAVLSSLAADSWTHLDLSGCSRLFGAELLAAAHKMPRLTTLDISGNNGACVTLIGGKRLLDGGVTSRGLLAGC